MTKSNAMNNRLIMKFLFYLHDIPTVDRHRQERFTDSPYQNNICLKEKNRKKTIEDLTFV